MIRKYFLSVHTIMKRKNMSKKNLSPVDYKALETLFKKHGYADFKWVDPKRIVVSQWVRMKCMYGCKDYGRVASCPPNVPSVSECRKFFDEYKTVAMFHFEKKLDKPEDRRPWGIQVNQGLLDLERGVFLSGYHKAFLLLMYPCRICGECSSMKVDCKNPKFARPTPEAMAIDVFSTARRYGYPIKVLSDYGQTMNRYAFLFIE